MTLAIGQVTFDVVLTHSFVSNTNRWFYCSQNNATLNGWLQNCWLMSLSHTGINTHSSRLFESQFRTSSTTPGVSTVFNLVFKAITEDVEVVFNACCCIGIRTGYSSSWTRILGGKSSLVVWWSSGYLYQSTQNGKSLLWRAKTGLFGEEVTDVSKSSLQVRPVQKMLQCQEDDQRAFEKRSRK